MSFSHVVRGSIFILFFGTGVSGIGMLTVYSLRPGANGNVSIDSVRQEMQRVGAVCATRPSVVVFYHPRCSCTTSSVRMLERLTSCCRPSPQITGYAFCPLSESDKWIDTPLTRKIRSLPRSRVIVDRGGAVCDRTGVSVSGHVLVIDTLGNVSFSGGITPSRAHEGDSAAGAQFERCLNRPCAYSAWPVFGCHINDIREG